MAVALDQIDRHGLAAPTVHEVARQLDVYPTAIYWRVPNRDALLAAVVEHTMEFPTLARHLPALANKACIVRWQSGSEAPMKADAPARRCTRSAA
ncbi:MAG TPA: TetR family transcriptional regulator [Paraburkholderia sp.]|uniref:TetR/AcrR family transcriptional regulator n=1 Tax=Paraburkholderia sp. TaxID=1926495 RepID=UPI002ED55542